MSAQVKLVAIARDGLIWMALKRQAVVFSFLSVMVAEGPARAQEFTAVSAGDVTETDAVLWTQIRFGDGTHQTAAKSDFVQLEISTEPHFSSRSRLLHRYGYTWPQNGNTVKFGVKGLTPNTKYYYRFTRLGGPLTSETGRFTTTPRPEQFVPLKIAFTGDYDASYRPFTLMYRFAQQPAARDVRYFLNLGDLVYETQAKGSPAWPSLTPNSPPLAKQGLDEFYRKYLENITGVDAATGLMSTSPKLQQGAKGLLAATSVYASFDNHELYYAMASGGGPKNSQLENYLCGDNQFPAPPGAPCLPSAWNPGPDYVNKTVSFQTMAKAFFNTQATAANIDGLPAAGLTFRNLEEKEQAILTPHDPRTNGTAQSFFSRSWGKAAKFIQLDDRTYRDARMFNTSPRVADNPKRTMLGNTQLEWFERQLLDAEKSGFIWKVVSISSPIDAWTDINGKPDTKTWRTSFNYERNEIMKFIVDRNIKNVLFITTDSHLGRISRLDYQPQLADLGSKAKWALVPYAFQILSGPAGAGGPWDSAKKYGGFDIAASQRFVAQKNAEIAKTGAPEIGLMGYPGLYDIYREGDPRANAAPQSVDFFQGTTYNYATVAWDARANLRVEYWGIDAYAPETFPKACANDPASASCTRAPRLLFAISVHPARQSEAVRSARGAP